MECGSTQRWGSVWLSDLDGLSVSAGRRRSQEKDEREAEKEQQTDDEEDPLEAEDSRLLRYHPIE
jgi:hypothetical protein